MTNLFITNTRMLELWDYAVARELVADDDAWCKKIGFARGNLSNVRTGLQSFTIKHILAAATVTGANVNWIFGLEPAMFRNKKQLTPLQMLHQAVKSVETELAQKSAKTGKKTA